MKKKSVIVKNLRVFYYQSESVNKKGCFVFLPGWGNGAEIFTPILKENRNFIALDLPGFGQSEFPVGKTWGLDNYADFLKDFLAKLKIKKPILVGHSFGGSVAIKYTALYNKISKLILIASAGIREQTIKSRVSKFLAPAMKIILSNFLPAAVYQKWRHKFYTAIQSDYLTAGEMRSTYLKIIKEDIKSDLKKIKTPTILIWGENDKATPLAHAQIMRDLIKGAKLFVIPNAGHYVFLDNPKDFNDIFYDNQKLNLYSSERKL